MRLVSGVYLNEALCQRKSFSFLFPIIFFPYVHEIWLIDMNNDSGSMAVNPYVQAPAGVSGNATAIS